MGNSLLRAGAGWVLAEAIECDDVLVVRDVDLRENRFCWRQIAFNPPERKEIATGSQPYDCQPIFDSRRRGLIYLDSGGISISSTDQGQSRQLWPTDSQKVVEAMWLDPSGSTLFFLEKEMESRRLPDEEIKGTTVTVTRQRQRDLSLQRLDLNSFQHSSVRTFGKEPVSASVDWERGQLLAAIGNRIESIDLESGASRILRETSSHYELSLMPGGRIFIWQWQGSNLEEVGANGNPAIVEESVRSPAFSPDGLNLAFLRNANELWLHPAGGVGGMVVACPQSDSALMDLPNWSACGRFLAASLAVSGENGTTRELVIADTVARKVVSIRNEGHSFSGGRIWLPSRTRL